MPLTQLRVEQALLERSDQLVTSGELGSVQICTRGELGWHARTCGFSACNFGERSTDVTGVSGAVTRSLFQQLTEQPLELDGDTAHELARRPRDGADVLREQGGHPLAFERAPAGD